MAFMSDDAQADFTAMDTGDSGGDQGFDGGDSGGSTGEVDTTPTGGSPTPAVEDDPTYEVKVGGKTFKVPLSELRNGYQRQSDYSRKTMEIAEMRKNWERERQEVFGKVAELRKWISDPNNLKSYYTQLTQQMIDANDDEPLTPAKAQEMIAASLRQQEAALAQKQQMAMQELEVKQNAAQINAELGNTIKGLLTSHPELGSVDGIEALLYRDVAALEPENIEEAKRFFAEAAQKRAEKIRALFTEQRKQEVVREDKLKNGIQPPGGMPAVSTQQKKFKLGSSDLVKQVMNDLMAGEK